MDSLNWRKPSYSGGQGGNCVEVASSASAVLVRDTKNRNGAVLSVSAAVWERFVTGLK